MLPRSQDNQWVSRTKWLTQALIISGTLNIGLISTFIYFVLKDKQEALSIELKPASKESGEALATNIQLLRSYSLLPYQELLLRLENRDHIEEGLAKRDLALACLVAFHHFNLDKALGGLPLQKRTIPFTNNDGQETIDVPVFPGLADYQFLAIMQYAKTEKWPLTSQGLFHEIKRAASPRDPSLLDSFYLSPEYHAAYTLLTKSGLNLTREQVVDLIAEGDWKTLSDLSAQQRTAMDLTPDRRRAFLVDYLNNHSRIAAKLLLDTDFEFVSKRLDDGQILTLLDLYTDKTSFLQNFAKELLASPRTDAVWKRAASLLYILAGEQVPEPYDHLMAVQRFLPQASPKPAPEAPQPLIVQTKASVQAPAPAPSKSKKRTHTIEQGDNLWKIARKYHVSVEEIMRANRMDSEKLRPGKQLEIPEKSEKKR
ncbi:MAG: LysM peptidoglycan-binding domain-containing protein [Verrucomicrobia bacterium]|nr:LysM peptidoglycan-binding domain-containing protein [Verrucomicrobiota bacterium]